MEASTQRTADQPAFHADDAEQVVGYRTLSSLAMVGLIIGLVSPVCFAWSLLLAIPLFGAVVCVFALRRIEASDGALAGSWMATLGLILCVVSGTATVSRDFMTRIIRTSQAEAFGQQWLELVLSGDTELAFRKTVAGNRLNTGIPEPGAPEPTQTPLEQFLAEPAVTELKAAGPGSTIHPAKTVAFEPQAGNQYIVQKQYLVEPPDEKQHAEIEVLLTIQRSRLAGEQQPRWLITSHELTHEAGEAAHVH